MAKPDFIFIGIRGSVVALDKKSGARLWETKLKGSNFVSLLVDQDRVLAGAQGEMFCLDASTGQILWHDGLKGYGFGLLSIATADGNTDASVMAAEIARRQQEASSAAAGSSTTAAS
jgi:outer membrane protein assembly factor BamB